MRRVFIAYTLVAAAVAFASSAAAQPQSQPPTPTPQQSPAQPPAPPQQPPAVQPGPQPPQPTGTTGTITPIPEPAPPAPMCVPPDMTSSVAMLDRAQRILDEARKDTLGKVSLDRGGLDELLAIVEQVRAVIAPVKQP